jgi:predicted nucleic acid-binding protein
MTMHVERCFVDTNVLVYSTIGGNPWYDSARHWLATLSLQRNPPGTAA